jgi:hypothetical protein
MLQLFVESEYTAATAILEDVYLRAKLSEMLQITPEESTEITCDNQEALASPMINHGFRRKVEYVLRYALDRDYVDKDQVKFKFIPASSQPADILTNALEPVKHRRAIEFLGTSLI